MLLLCGEQTADDDGDGDEEDPDADCLHCPVKQDARQEVLKRATKEVVRVEGERKDQRKEELDEKRQDKADWGGCGWRHLALLSLSVFFVLLFFFLSFSF